MTEQESGVTTEQEVKASELSNPSEDIKQEDALVDATNPTKTEITEETPKKSETVSAFEKRINRMRAALGDKERQLLELAEKVKAYEANKPQEKQAGEPQESDFETTEEYLEARGAWKKEQEYKQKDQERQRIEKEEKYKAELSEKAQAFQKKGEEFRKVTPYTFLPLS